MSIDFALAWIRSRLGADQETNKVRDTASDADRLDALRDLAKIVAVVGTPCDCTLLAKILDMAPHDLKSCLELAAAQSLVEVVNGQYVKGCRNPGGSIRADTEATIHRRAAECLVRQEVLRTSVQAARIAEHFQSGQCWRSAFDWWREATERAMANGHLREASRHLERALGICSEHQGVVPSECELAALNMMGPIRAQIDGSGADEVAAIYARCSDLAAHAALADTASAFKVLWGLAACILVHGRLDTARELCIKLQHIAELSGDSACLLLAARLCGLGQFLGGELDDAIASFAIVERLYERKRHAELRFEFASDQGAVALAHRAWAETIAGRREESERTSKAALDLSRGLHHPHTSAHVACVLAARAQTLQDRGRSAPLATAGNALARRYDFAYWLAWSELILGWHAGGRSAKEGVDRTTAAIAAYRRTGATQALPYAHMVLADLALLAGDSQLMIAATDAASTSADGCGVRIFESETLRIKAHAVESSSERRRLLHEAIEKARCHGAHLFEARARADLAILCQ